MPQPMRSGGSRPCTLRSKAARHFGRRDRESAALMSAGGAPAVSVVGQTTIAAFRLDVVDRYPRRAFRRRVEQQAWAARRAQRNQRGGARLACHDPQPAPRSGAESCRRKNSPWLAAG